MKISKERLKQILKEEMRIAEQEQEETEELMKTKGAFSKKLLELSKEVRSVKGLDAVEMQKIMNITLSLIQSASAGTLGPKLVQIEQIISKRIGEPK